MSMTRHIEAGWCSGIVECLDCGTQWAAVWPIGADDLYCPECGSQDTIRGVVEEVADRHKPVLQ